MLYEGSSPPPEEEQRLMYEMPSPLHSGMTVTFVLAPFICILLALY